jgi:hypothetical protein
MYSILFTLLAANSYLLYRGIFNFAIKPSDLDSDDEDDSDLTAFGNTGFGDVSDEWHYYAMAGYYHSRLINEIRNGEPVKLRTTDVPSQDNSSASAT